jgi:hypothetical protein
METQEKSLREILDEEKKANESVGTIKKEPIKEKYKGALALLTDRYTKKEGQFNSENGYTIMLKNKSSKLKIEYQPHGDDNPNYPQINIYTGSHVLKQVNCLYKTKNYYHSEMNSRRNQNALKWWEKFLLDEAGKVYQEQKNDGDAAQNPNVQSTENQKNPLEKLLDRDIDMHTKNLYESAMSVLKDSHAKKEGHMNSNGDYSVEKKGKFSQIKITYERITYSDEDDHNKEKSYNRLGVYTGRHFKKSVLSMHDGNLYAYQPGKWEELLVNDGIFTQSQRKSVTIKYPYINRVGDFVNCNADEIFATTLFLGGAAGISVGVYFAYNYSPMWTAIGILSAFFSIPAAWFIAAAKER